MPPAQVVYADYDPVVVRHADHLIGGALFTAAVQADLRQPRSLLAHPTGGLEMTEPGLVSVSDWRPAHIGLDAPAPDPVLRRDWPQDRSRQAPMSQASPSATGLTDVARWREACGHAPRTTPPPGHFAPATRTDRP